MAISLLVYGYSKNFEVKTPFFCQIFYFTPRCLALLFEQKLGVLKSEMWLFRYSCSHKCSTNVAYKEILSDTAVINGCFTYTTLKLFVKVFLIKSRNHCFFYTGQAITVSVLNLRATILFVKEKFYHS